MKSDKSVSRNEGRVMRDFMDYERRTASTGVRGGSHA